MKRKKILTRKGRAIRLAAAALGMLFYANYACNTGYLLPIQAVSEETERIGAGKLETVEWRLDPEMDEFLEKAGITLLRDEYVLIDDSFYLYGRPDYERPGRGIDKRKTPQEITEGMDVSLPVLVIDHEPRELQELADTGVDVDLCGHTHDGQVFPGNIVIRFFWENPCGYLKKGNMHNIVTYNRYCLLQPVSCRSRRSGCNQAC